MMSVNIFRNASISFNLIIIIRGANNSVMRQQMIACRNMTLFNRNMTLKVSSVKGIRNTGWAGIKYRKSIKKHLISIRFQEFIQ